MPFPNFKILGSQTATERGDSQIEEKHVRESVLPSRSNQDLMGAEFDGPAVPAGPQVDTGLPGFDSDFAAPPQPKSPASQPEQLPVKTIGITQKEYEEYQQYKLAQDASTRITAFVNRHSLAPRSELMETC